MHRLRGCSSSTLQGRSGLGADAPFPVTSATAIGSNGFGERCMKIQIQRPLLCQPQPVAWVTGAASLRRAGNTVLAPENLQQAGGSSTQGKRVTISYDESTAEDVAVPLAQSNGARTLKINVDLMLWRARQARIRAQLTLDAEQRRALLQESEAGLRRCLALDPADGRTYVVLGKLLVLQRRYNEARELYADGCANTGNANPFIWAAWGWLELKTGDVARARKLFDAATVVDSTHACAWHKWGMLEKSQGNYLRARDLWMQGIQKCRRRPQAQNAYLYNALAVMAGKLGRVQEARAWFEEGTRTLEGAASVALWQAWAVMEAKQGDKSAVRYLFKKALGANPRSRYVYLAWGLWERQQGNVPQCMDLLQRGLRFNPTDAALHQVQAVLLSAAHYVQLGCLEELPATAGIGARAFQAMALVQWRECNNVEAARQFFQQGVAADPHHLPLWQAWGCMEAALNNVDRARSLFQEGAWADPGSQSTVWVFHAWGWLEYKSGNPSLARELFRAAVRVDPKAELVWNTWISMEEELNFIERADELRIRRAEQQWEFDVPSGFTTRPWGLDLLDPSRGDDRQESGSSRAATTSSSSPGTQAPSRQPPPASQNSWAPPPLSTTLEQLTGSLARFFHLRSKAAASTGSSIQQYLPSDYRADMELQEALKPGELGGPEMAAALLVTTTQATSTSIMQDQSRSNDSSTASRKRPAGSRGSVFADMALQPMGMSALSKPVRASLSRPLRAAAGGNELEELAVDDDIEEEEAIRAGRQKPRVLRAKGVAGPLSNS